MAASSIRVGALVRLAVYIASIAVLTAVFLPSASKAETMGDHLWNLQENPEDFFHDNDSWVRPWRFNQDDGYGMFQGGHQGSFHWDTYSTAGNALDGSLSIARGVDHQFDAWTFLYVPTPTTLLLTGDGDCVPRWFLNYVFDSPQQFPLGTPASINLAAGWNRLDITGYNQNRGFLFVSSALVGQVAIMNTSPVPEPSTIALMLPMLAAGIIGFLRSGRKMLAKKRMPVAQSIVHSQDRSRRSNTVSVQSRLQFDRFTADAGVAMLYSGSRRQRACQPPVRLKMPVHFDSGGL